MNTPNYDTPPPLPEQGIGMSIASLVLGILAAVLGLFVIGAVLGVMGLILGLVYIRNHRRGRAMAAWGVALSIIGIILGTAFGVFYYSMVGQIIETGSSLVDTEDMTSQWEGVLSPDFSVTTLDSQTITLSELKGKRVILDFWATWYPPCKREIPHFIQLAKEIPPEKLIIIGISDEDNEILEEFRKQNDVNYPLASASNLPAPYNEIMSVPTTFFIDRNGVIQSILSGYEDYNTLREKALAPDYEGSPKDISQVGPAELTPLERPLTPITVWSSQMKDPTALCAGDWNGDHTDEILILEDDSTLHILDQKGTENAEIPFPTSCSEIEIGYHKELGPRLLARDQMNMSKVMVIDQKGKEVWKYKYFLGIDGAHWGDLDGDGTDEMIVGMNAFGGLHAVSAKGKKLWKKSIGNVWNQAIVSAHDGHPALVFATEAYGSIRVFDAEGNSLRILRPSRKYYTQITAARINSAGDVQIIAMGDALGSREDTCVVVCDETGKIAWAAPCEKSSSFSTNVNFSSNDVNGDGLRDWVFRESGTSLAIASPKGEKFCSISVPKGIKTFAAGGNPAGKGLIVVLDETNLLTAYQLN